MIKKLFLLTVLFFPFSAFSVERMPWFGPSFALETRVNCLLQVFDRVDTPRGKQNYRSFDQLYSLELLLPLFDEWGFEFEMAAFDSKKHTLNLDYFSFTGAYKWMNDITARDPVTLTTGLTVYKVFRPARRDIALIRHGGLEAELFASVGQEHSYRSFWTSRWWLAGGLGVADLGSPWIFCDVHWDWNWFNTHQFGAFVQTLWGLGGRSLYLDRPFHGYGPIAHQSIDAGLYYEYLFECNPGKIRGEYSYRLLARNCPKNVNFFKISLIYPFGLGI